MKNIFSKKEVFKIKSLPYDPLIMAQPSTTDEYRQRGRAYNARKQYEAVVEDLEQAIRLVNRNIEADYPLGIIYKAMESIHEALSAYTQVLVPI